LIFKGTIRQNNSISGKSDFCWQVPKKKKPYRIRAMIGTFSATLALADKEVTSVILTLNVTRTIVRVEDVTKQ
jgi:hypothetical protein